MNGSRFGPAVALFLLGHSASQPVLGQTIRSTFYDGGPDAYVEYPHEARFDSSVAMTIEAWVRPIPPIGLNPTIVSHDFTQSFWFGLQTAGASAARLRFYRSGGLGANSTGTFAINRWTHVAAVYDGTEVHFYIDGNDAGSLPLTNAGAGFDTPLFIGGHRGGCCSSPSGLSFLGLINEVRIWTGTRTQEQLRSGMFQQLRGVTNLAAVFDTGGRHEDIAEAVGTSGAGASERIEGIIPHDMVVPAAAFPSRLAVDGVVDLFDEYLQAEQLVIRYRAGSEAVVGQANAYLVHIDTNLHVGVCRVSSTAGGWDPDQSWIGLLIDPNYSRDPLAQTTDYQTQNYLGATAPQFLIGNGVGSYGPPSIPPMK